MSTQLHKIGIVTSIGLAGLILMILPATVGSTVFLACCPTLLANPVPGASRATLDAPGGSDDPAAGARM